jgi:hypothetical protein
MIELLSWSRELGHNFKKAGDINKASEGLKEEFKIHDQVIGNMKLKITKKTFI